MKRIVSLFLVIFLVFSFFSCKGREGDEETADTKDKLSAESETGKATDMETKKETEKETQAEVVKKELSGAYKEIVDEYREALSMEHDAFESAYLDGKFSTLNTLMLMNYHRNFKTEYAGDFYYALHDIDKNGVDELVIITNDMAIDVYTIKDAESFRLFDENWFGERTFLYILNDGKIVVEGSGGAAMKGCEVYTIAQDGRTAVVKEAFYYDDATDENYMAANGYTKYSRNAYMEKIKPYLSSDIIESIEKTIIE